MCFWNLVCRLHPHSLSKRCARILRMSPLLRAYIHLVCVFKCSARTFGARLDFKVSEPWSILNTPTNLSLSIIHWSVNGNIWIWKEWAEWMRESFARSAAAWATAPSAVPSARAQWRSVGSTVLLTVLQREGERAAEAREKGRVDDRVRLFNRFRIFREPPVGFLFV